MSERITHIPEGLADILCDDCELKFNIESVSREVFKSRGYKMVQAPMFEYSEVYDVASTTSSENIFRFFDGDGRMLSLRPDITTSIARMAATKFSDSGYPLRLSYIGSAFRNDEAFSQARQREFTQVGVELIGENSAAADSEVIEIAIETLEKSGLRDFQIDMGHIGFFKGIVEQAGLSENDTMRLREAIYTKSFSSIEGILRDYDLDDEIRDIIIKLPTMFGGIEIIDEVSKYKCLGEVSCEALENLSAVYEILKSHGAQDRVSIDLGMIPNLDYYTGLVIKGFTYGIGFPICTGGRYDNLISKFGKNLPATGISIGVERVMSALNDMSREDYNKQDNEYITVALAKGRLAELSIEIFEKIGLNCSEMKSKTRKLVFTDEENKMKFVLVKASDVPTYVEYGAADIGIVGKDTLLEYGKNLYEVLDLGFGKCKMAVAGPAEMKDKLVGRNIMRVASKYTNIARDYFHNVKGQTVDIIKLHGSVELGPLVGLSEVIVDIVETGKTLKENGLEVLEEICDVSARLVVNRVSLKLHRERINDIITRVKGEL